MAVAIYNTVTAPKGLTLHTAGATVDDRHEPQRRVVERDRGHTVDVRAVDLDDLRPARRHLLGVVALHLRGRDGGDQVGADRLLPVRPGGAPRSHGVLAAGLLVDFEERPTRVGRVQLHVGEALFVELSDDPDAEVVDSRPPGRMVVGLRDDHVAAGALAA